MSKSKGGWDGRNWCRHRSRIDSTRSEVAIPQDESWPKLHLDIVDNNFRSGQFGKQMDSEDDWPRERFSYDSFTIFIQFWVIWVFLLIFLSSANAFITSAILWCASNLDRPLSKNTFTMLTPWRDSLYHINPLVRFSYYFFYTLMVFVQK